MFGLCFRLSYILWREHMMEEIPEELLNIAKEYNIRVYRDLENGEPDNGYSAIDEIMLNHFDDPDLERFAFFHELAHCIGRRLLFKALGIPYRSVTGLSTISDEGFCWEVALILAEKYGYYYKWGEKERTYALKAYDTYLKDI